MWKSQWWKRPAHETAASNLCHMYTRTSTAVLTCRRAHPVKPGGGGSRCREERRGDSPPETGTQTLYLPCLQSSSSGVGALGEGRVVPSYLLPLVGAVPTWWPPLLYFSFSLGCCPPSQRHWSLQESSSTHYTLFFDVHFACCVWNCLHIVSLGD